MAKKNQTTLLLILLVVLLAVFALLQLRNKKTESTLNRDLVTIDTARVTQIVLYPQSLHGKMLQFTKGEKGWRVADDKREAQVESGNITNMLTELMNIRPKRLASVSDTAWAGYGVTDSTATRVVVKEGKKQTLDLYIGKFSVDKSAQMYRGYQGGIRGSSFIRLADKKEVYEVEGFLSLSFNQGFDNWRDHLFVHTTGKTLNKVTFTYPADSGFVLTHADSLWNLDGMPADSAGVAQYLSNWSFKRYADFVDSYTPPANPDYQITAEGPSMDPVVIQAYRDAENNFVMHSSINPETWFADKDSTIFKIFFVPKGKFEVSTK